MENSLKVPYQVVGWSCLLDCMAVSSQEGRTGILFSHAPHGFCWFRRKADLVSSPPGIHMACSGSWKGHIYLLFFLLLFSGTTWLLHIFIQSFIDGHLDIFYILPVLNKVTLNVDMPESFWHADFISFGYIPRKGRAQLYGQSIFSLSRNLQTVFHKGTSNVQSVWGFPFLYIFISFFHFYYFDPSHSNWDAISKRSWSEFL